jgi:hypothetical protein
MDVRITSETGRPQDTKITDDSGNPLFFQAVQIDISEHGVMFNLVVHAMFIDVAGKARVSILDPHAGVLKEVSRIEFRDGTSFDVPVTPIIAIVPAHNGKFRA